MVCSTLHYASDAMHSLKILLSTQFHGGTISVAWHRSHLLLESVLIVTLSTYTFRKGWGFPKSCILDSQSRSCSTSVLDIWNAQHPHHHSIPPMKDQRADSNLEDRAFTGALRAAAVPVLLAGAAEALDGGTSGGAHPAD